MEKLTKIQYELKAPKKQYNSFGKYNYRSCEDILDALKPLLNKYNASVIIADDILQIGTRFYVKATATFIDNETGQQKMATALAREPESKKGMDESQITGTASSYARKYCLNGLFLIDDTKDADTDENRSRRNRNSRLRKSSIPMRSQRNMQNSMLSNPFANRARSANRQSSTSSGRRNRTCRALMNWQRINCSGFSKKRTGYTSNENQRRTHWPVNGLPDQKGSGYLHCFV